MKKELKRNKPLEIISFLFCLSPIISLFLPLIFSVSFDIILVTIPFFLFGIIASIIYIFKNGNNYSIVGATIGFFIILSWVIFISNQGDWIEIDSPCFRAFTSVKINDETCLADSTLILSLDNKNHIDNLEIQVENSKGFSKRYSFSESLLIDSFNSTDLKIAPVIVKDKQELLCDYSDFLDSIPVCTN